MLELFDSLSVIVYFMSSLNSNIRQSHDQLEDENGKSYFTVHENTQTHSANRSNFILMSMKIQYKLVHIIYTYIYMRFQCQAVPIILALLGL